MREIYDYTAEHYSEWFPELPSYQGYNRRLNRMSAVFAPLVGEALSKIDHAETREEVVRIADSMPIMMASGKRASQAKVAPGSPTKATARQKACTSTAQSYTLSRSAAEGRCRFQSVPG